MKTNPTPIDPQIRLIDANANRASEGLRTLEDLARFVLENAEISGSCKAQRHELNRVTGTLPISQALRLDSRDTPRDPGTTLSTPGEHTRAGMDSIAAAAAGRATESIRVLEELCKPLGLEFGERFEAIRYAVYEIEKQLRLGLLARAPQWSLCVLLTSELCGGRDPALIAQASIEGGAGCIQIREKAMDSGPLLELAKKIVALAKPRGVSVIINDRADLARLSGADGVHVGQSDLSVSEARRIAGAGAIIGVSTANLEQATRAVADGASYCGCGPMFPSTTKAKPTLSGPEYLRAYLADQGVRGTPHLAISGITSENIERLAESGCRGVAVSSAVCVATDPAAVCRGLISAMSREGATRDPSPTTLGL